MPVEEICLIQYVELLFFISKAVSPFSQSREGLENELISPTTIKTGNFRTKSRHKNKLKTFRYETCHYYSDNDFRVTQKVRSIKQLYEMK